MNANLLFTRINKIRGGFQVRNAQSALVSSFVLEKHFKLV